MSVEDCPPSQEPVVGRFVVTARRRDQRMDEAVRLLPAEPAYPVLVLVSDRYLPAWLQRLQRAHPGHVHRLRQPGFADIAFWSAAWVPRVAPAPVFVVATAEQLDWHGIGSAVFGAVVVDVAQGDTLEMAADVTGLVAELLVVLDPDPYTAATAAALTGAQLNDLDAKVALPAGLRARVEERPAAWTEQELAVLKVIDVYRPVEAPDLEAALRSSTGALWAHAADLYEDEEPVLFAALEAELEGLPDEEATFDEVFAALECHGHVLVCTSHQGTAADLEQALEDQDIQALRSEGAFRWQMLGGVARGPARVYIAVDGSAPSHCPPVGIVVHVDLPRTRADVAQRMRLADRLAGAVAHSVVTRPGTDQQILELLAL